MVCEHLAALEKELIAAGVPITYRGQAWSDNCREWVYFDCCLDRAAIDFGACGLACPSVREDTPRLEVSDTAVCPRSELGSGSCLTAARRVTSDTEVI